MEKLLKLYEELADHRLIVINNLLDEIAYILDEAKNYGDEDYKILKEIAKIKELEK